MEVKQFNFNNEVDAFEIHVHEDGSVTVPDENGNEMAHYDSVEQLAEIYAQARGVKPENLKNWVLLENGEEYTYVLRAGTAGVSVSEAYEQIEAALDRLTTYHPLNVARAKEQILSDGDKDLTDALVHCTETEIARDVYDRLAAVINGAETEPEEPVEVDDRTELQKYVDDMAEVPGAIAFLAQVVGVDSNSDKDSVATALAESYVLSNVESLKTLYSNAINEACAEGIGVGCEEDALTVITQIPAGRKDDGMKSRIIATAKMASRKKVNVPVDIVGRKHIKHTAEMVTVEDIENMDLYVRGNVAFIVRFDETIDQTLEAENGLSEDGDEEDRDTTVGFTDEYADEDEDREEDEYDE